MKPETPITIRAYETAAKAHAHISLVTVSGVQLPQMVHLQQVADLVWASGGTEEEIAAAWLHDIVEDTPTTIIDIENKFGKKIAEIVAGLTDLEHFASLPVEERKRKQSERVKNESENVRRIKLADQTSNVRSLALDPSATFPVDGCRKYVIGAKLIAEQCKGISPMLEKLFDDAYSMASKRYNI